MNAFEWANAKSPEDAVKLLTPGATGDPDQTHRPIGGGQDLHTTMKAYIQRPSRVVNLKTIPQFGQITVDASGVTLGATATLTDIEEHEGVLKAVPGLAEAIHSVASPQIRNIGTIGGNLCQRPRCWYFRLEEVKCLRRGGHTCYAHDGENKYHAIFNTDGPCVIVHPSDPAPLLTAVGAVLTVAGPNGTRQIPIGQFFVLPTDDFRRENVLAGDEIITQVTIPASALAKRSTYLKFKERESLDFAMASVAAAVDLEGGTVKSARVVLGGVAPIPWQLPKVNEFLAGKKLDEATIAKAAEMAIDGAVPLSQNAYKLPLVKTLVKRALTKLA